MRKISSERRSAFTLIEIMVAAVITVIMIGLVIQITGEVLKVWNRSMGKLSANAEARIAMDFLTSDLEAAVMQNNGLQWLRSEKATDGPGGANTVALRLFSPALDQGNGPGNICAIAYQLKNSNPVSGSLVEGSPDDRLWILYRLRVNPEDTFTDLMGEPEQNELPDKDTLTWSRGATAASILGNNGGNYLASNIVQFDIDFYVVDDGDADTPILVPDETIFGGQANDGKPLGTVGSGAYPDDVEEHFRYPLAYAQINLTIVSDEGASLLQNLDKVKRSGENSEDDTINRIIREHGEVFKRRVHFQAKPF